MITNFSSKFFGVCFTVCASFTFLLQMPVLADTIEPPPGSGAPSGTVGGASRPLKSICLPPKAVSQHALIALAPGKQIGLTALGRPKFVIFLPDTIAQTIEISLFDAQMRGVYQTTIAKPNQTGLVNLELPSTAPALEIGKRYYWTVALVCNQQDRTEDWVTGGWIQRSTLPSELAAKLSGKTPLDRVALYAQAGFWYDAFNTLIELQNAPPASQAIAKTWGKLLKSVGLETLVTVKPTK